MQAVDSGTLLAIGSGILYGITNFFQKVEVLSLNPFQLAFFYSLVAVLLLIPFFLVKRRIPTIDDDDKIYVFIVCILQSANIILVVLSMNFISVFSADTIFDTSTIFTSIFSYLILREYLDLYDVLVLIIAVSGIVIVAISNIISHQQTTNPMNQLYGTLIALVSSMVCGAEFVLVRKIQSTYATTIVLYSFILSTLVNFILGMTENVIRINFNFKEFGVICLIAVLLMLILISQFEALQRQLCLVCNLAFCLDIPVVFALQSIFLKEFPTKSQILGALIIVFSIICISLKNQILKNIKKLWHKCKPLDDEEQAQIIQ